MKIITIKGYSPVMKQNLEKNKSFLVPPELYPGGKKGVHPPTLNTKL